MKKRKTLPYFLIAASLLLVINAVAQKAPSPDKDSLANSYTDISKIAFKKEISNVISSIYINKDQDPASLFSQLHFIPGLKHYGTIPNKYVTRKVLVKFNITNSSDSSISTYFFPGFYYWSIRLYRAENNGLKRIPPLLPKNEDSIGFRRITLAGHDSATIIAELRFVKTYINGIRPRLINPDFLNSFVSDLHVSKNYNDLFTYLFCGLLLMMIFYSFSNFLQGANREFLFYSGYAFFLGSMLFSKAILNFHNSYISFFLEGYLDFILQGLGIIFYMIFMQRFLDTRNKHRFLFKLYNVGVLLMAVSLLGYSYFHYFSDNFSLENLIETASKVLLLLMTVIFLVYSSRHWKDILLRYVFWGNLCLFIFSVISQTIIFTHFRFKSLPDVFSSSLFYYEFGLLLELVFFLAGLNYKNRRQIISQTKEREQLKAENIMKEYEKELAVYKAQQQERERISADMHDELGSGMTAIRLLSEIARNKMKENTPVEIEKISSSANDVLNKMNGIIWSMNSSNDTLDNLISYVRAYSLEYFENTPIVCKVNSPQNIPNKELTGDKRRNIFLCVKESLNNAWKHSSASLITIDIEINHSLVIRIADNGKGIDMEQLRQFGNGLKNMARRMETIGGNFTIKNENGTVTTLELPL
ncbi:MAG: 7TM diverse intracellular signaling domain-containing protein [Bacteroidota bacterium]